MKILVCGSRHWTDVDLIVKYLSRFGPNVEIIEGGARGADTAANRAAVQLGLKVTTVEAEWERLGSKAGPLRNRKMLDMLNPKEDRVAAFHEDLSKSRGTIDTVFEANRRSIVTEIIGTTPKKG